MDGMFPGNHTEVAVGNATIFILYSFIFCLFLNGEELFLPIYSFCVCVNTFILNLKLIKYHLSQPTIFLNILYEWKSICTFYSLAEMLFAINP